MSTRGFALVEVMLTIGVLAVVTLAMATGIGAGHRASSALETEVLIAGRGQALVETLAALPFGDDGDGAASSAELSELFDGDDDFGTITLTKLEQTGPVEFDPAAFSVPGRWRVTVTADLDLDGSFAGDDEDRRDLFRLDVAFDGRPIAHTLRYDTTR